MNVQTITIFTPEMLSQNNFGLYIIKSLVTDITEGISYNATVAFKLGYTNHKFVNHDLRYGLINFLTDGWFCPVAKNQEDLCEFLNNNPHGSKYRLMTKEEVLFLIKSRDQGFL